MLRRSFPPLFSDLPQVDHTRPHEERSRSGYPILYTLVLTLLCVGGGSPLASAQDAPQLELSFEAALDELRIGVSANAQPIPPSQISARRDKAKRLRFTIDGGYQCPARYIKDWRAPKLKRVYLYPSKKVKGRCYLLIRMTRRIPKRRAKAIEFTREATQTTAVFRWRAPKVTKAPKVAQASQTASTSKAKSSETPAVSAPADQGSEGAQAELQVISPQTTPQSAPEADTPEELLKVNFKSREESTEGRVAESEGDKSLAEAKSTPVPAGEVVEMKAPRDRVLSPNQPAEVLRTLVIGQLNKARTLSAAPVILSTPMNIRGGAPQDQLQLRRGARLLTALMDAEALQRGGGIWVADAGLRSQVDKLNPHSAQLSISQEVLVAGHVSADLISRSQLRLTDQDLTLTISMTPVGYKDNVPSDAGVYQVEHKLSREVLNTALDQAWVEEHRSAAIWRAALLPGWGHLYRGERRQGFTYLSAGLGLTIGAIISSSLGYLATQDYNNDSPETAHRRDDANAHYDRANLLWMGAAVVHLTSLVDTIVSAQDRSYLDLSRLDWEKAGAVTGETR